MGSRVGVDCVVLAETVNATSVCAEIELVDAEITESVVALDLPGVGKRILAFALGMDTAYIPEHD
jgi:hypothetical protein